MAVEFDVTFDESSTAFDVSFDSGDSSESILSDTQYVVHHYSEDLPIAKRDALGCVIVGANLSVTGNGTISGQPGTVTEIDTGVGLTGGPIASSGEIKADLKSDQAATYSSGLPTNVIDRQYPVVPDADGHLSVNVPWEDTNTTYEAMSQAEASTGTSTVGKLISAKVLTDTMTESITEAVSDLEDNLTAEISKKQDIPLWVNMGTITGTGSSVTTTKSVSGVTSDMKCTAYLLGTPSAQTGDWTVTTSNGSVTVSGTVNGSTTLEIKLEKVNEVS